MFCDNSNWQTVVSSKQKFVIKKQSLNEERIKSSRIRGELGIIADSSKLSFFIDWGDFANISDANIYYYINRYGSWEENWEMSDNGQISYSPDPMLMILEILSSDSIIIGIRPKNNNDIRYIFNTTGLRKHLYNNISLYNILSNSISDFFSNTNIINEKNIKTIFHEKIIIKRDTRVVRSIVKNNKNYFFKPIWFNNNVFESFSVGEHTNKLFYFNRWLKRKGVLFTEKDIRIAKYFKNKPDIITYDSIFSIESKGNSIIGHRININDFYTASFPGSNKEEVQSIVTFLKNRIIEKNKIL
ncbi:MAG: hypothetical protein CBE13_001465 [Candidatus Pelagibacter sp. TMED253]|nr:MAG: hypothetical protein CBE13_001465 [Candidatus Pelagibacter sp. TMED253]